MSNLVNIRDITLILKCILLKILKLRIDSYSPGLRDRQPQDLIAPRCLPDMKRLLLVFLASLPLIATVKGEEPAVETAMSALSPEIEIYSQSTELTPQTANGLLETTRVAIGTILKSHHFDKYDYHDYNESHDGVYLRVNDWSAGTYINSADTRSVFVSHNALLYQNNAITVDLVSGVANGYEGWENAQGDYLPILGISAQWMYLKSVLTYEAVTLGFELPLN